MKLNNLAMTSEWAAKGVVLPLYNVPEMTMRTKKSPVWVHFGAGNIFRGFIAALQQRLLNGGLCDKGIVVAEAVDYEIIDKAYKPFQNLGMNVILNRDATVSCEIIASVAEALEAGVSDNNQMNRLAEIFENPGLQMASFTITEKGYAIIGADGKPSAVAKTDMDNGPGHTCHVIGIFTALLLKRYLAGGRPIAAVSMDNCSRNGEKLKSADLSMAEAWITNGFAESGFMDYLLDESKVSFPWSMIDKITPRPDEAVEKILADKGIDGMSPFVMAKNTYIAPFINAERPQYLVIEDSFPNGRPPLEKAGVYMTERETVNKVERMKVTACLNPLHTAMSVYGCLLGYTRISGEMKDTDIVALIKRLGYTVLKENIMLQQFYYDEENIEKLWELDVEFHRLLFSNAGVLQVYALMSSMLIHLDRVRVMALMSSRNLNIIEDHEMILKSIVNGDAKAAKDLMHKHLTRYIADRELVEEKYSQYIRKK